MQFSSIFVAALLAATGAVAAPTPAGGAIVARAEEWSIDNMKRTCNKANTECKWEFNINAAGKNTGCTYTLKGNKASETQWGPAAKCGAYTITTGWSGQFGPGEGFTTFSVVDYNRKLIVWPAYTDKEVKAGKTVKPNKKYPVTKLA